MAEGDEIRAALREWERACEMTRKARAKQKAIEASARSPAMAAATRAVERANAAEQVAREHARVACCTTLELERRKP